ncbi:hypothetical protein BZA05DRAFT_390882 [Tricharina praecox]|uniref:uncharacterized protein n=1 Tax=Tricharina praecox TaxID=43433 RepID=UPI00221E6D58|nr:uncharacterized protein BZA05DRAFT_390882 [Tricharina praecox]KAI5855215.1 hypothetical protein BZA05DRAFT_390882 [Tricharina praecox]
MGYGVFFYTFGWWVWNFGTARGFIHIHNSFLRLCLSASVPVFLWWWPCRCSCSYGGGLGGCLERSEGRVGGRGNRRLLEIRDR